MTPPPIIDAATLILLRRGANGPAVLMGQRGAKASFMPNKFVFPGGAVDPVDHNITLAQPLDPICAARHDDHASLPSSALVAAAIRELWEETGLILGDQAEWPDAQKGWRGYAATGHRPSGHGLTFVFRAITPPGNSRRFDARFYLSRAEHLRSDPDDFSRAEDELRHLQWVPLSRARDLDLPFITQVVLAEIAANLGTDGPPPQVPFVRNTDESNMILQLRGAHPMDGA